MNPRLPPAAQKDFERAVSLFREGRLATADGICTELIARFPADAELAHFGGVLANRMGRYEIAVQRLARCVQSDPGRSRAHAALGLAQEQLGRFEDARRAFAAAVEGEPRFAEAHNGLGVALFRLGRSREAVASFDRAIALEPASVEARMNRARALRKLGLDAAAARSWREALRLAPARDDVRRLCALGLLESGDREEGLRALREHLQRDPADGVARMQLALALEAEGSDDEALREAGLAVESSPREAGVHNAQGTLLMRMGRWEEALAAFDASLALEPASPEARINQAMALRHVGRVSEALARMAEAEAGLDARGLAQLAAMYGVMDRSDKVMELVARALAEAPALAEAYATRAFETLRAGNLEAGWREHVFRPTRDRAIFDQVFAGRYPPRLPEQLEGARILVRVEQGLGDMLLFLRYAAPLAAAGAVLEVAGMDSRLQPMVARALAVSFADAPGTPGAIEVWAGDLPLFVRPLTGRDLEPSLPLTPLPERLARMRERLGPDAKWVGVAWRAGTSPKHGLVGQKLLSKQVDAATLGHALARWPGRAVVVQRHPSPGEIESFARALGAEVLDLSAANDDLEDMLALMAILDEYVGVSSTNVHLRLGAGRGGKVLVPHPADWRWQVAGESPWFPGFKAYREELEGGWDRALDELRQDLEREAR